jgi:ribosome-binding factor A
MAEPRRILRLQQLILEVVATTIQRELQDPRVGMVSITRVQLSSDLSAAHIYWSMLGTEAERRTSERGLQASLGLIQRRVAGALGTRVTPALSLHFDVSMQKAQRLNEIFEHLRIERGEPLPEPESAPAEVAEDDEDDEEVDDAEAIPPEDLPSDEDFEEGPE